MPSLNPAQASTLPRGNRYNRFITEPLAEHANRSCRPVQSAVGGGVDNVVLETCCSCAQAKSQKDRINASAEPEGRHDCRKASACDVTRSSLMRHQRRSQELRLGPISTILTGIQETGKQGRAAEHHGQGIKPATLISQACSQLHCKSFVVSSCCLLFLFLREVGEAPTHHRCHIKM